MLPDAATSLASSARNSMEVSQAAELHALHVLEAQRKRHAKRLKLSKLAFFRDAVRFKGSVLLRILPTLFVIMLWALLVAVANITYGKQWRTTDLVIGPLSVVFGLLIVFRTGNSYDRWFEGAKDWQNSLSDCRSLARFMWTNIDLSVLEDLPKDDVKARASAGNVNAQQHRERKKAAIRLLVLFLYASKHHLRGEKSLDHDDYTGLFSNALRASYERTLALVPPSTQPHGNGDESRPLLAMSDTLDAEPDLLAISQGLSLPYFCLVQLARYLAAARQSGALREAGQPSYAMVNQLLNNLTTTLGNQERVATMTVPAVYGIHLKQSSLLYLLALPFVLVNELGWRVVPFVGLVAFTLIGLEGIASEIEQPFHDAPSDHPLDFHCAVLRHEMECMMRAVPDALEDLV